jgi:hypothetical protein
MKKWEDIVADSILTVIRFFAGILLGFLLIAIGGRIKPGVFEWIFYGSNDLFLTIGRWILITIIFVIGVCSAIWGDKVINQLWRAIKGNDD